MYDYLKDFMDLFDEQIRKDSLIEIKIKRPGHSEPYYNNILNKAQNIARSSNLSIFDVVTSEKFWQENA